MKRWLAALMWVAGCGDGGGVGSPVLDEVGVDGAAGTDAASDVAVEVDLGRPDVGVDAATADMAPPEPVEIAELETWSMPFPDGPAPWVVQGPVGMRWDAAREAIVWTPDWTQGGRTYAVEIAQGADRHTFDLAVVDSVVVAPMEVVSRAVEGDIERIQLRQPGDPWLDPEGRTHDVFVMAPVAGSVPVRVRFHGFLGGPDRSAWPGEVRVALHDPRNTYWWGELGPDGFAPYTQRRALHALAWTLDNVPAADPARVYAEGQSMGAAGALLFALRNPARVAWVDARIGQGVPQNHRPSRVAQLTPLWGPMGPDWAAADITAIWRDVSAAREVPVFLKHGKDDPLIHFGAVVHPSPLTGLSVYDALQTYRIGHLAVWDEGGHGLPDPVLPDGWWQAGWNPVFDDTTQARTDQAFVAFSGASHDEDPGTGGNGRVGWDAESGYAADVFTPGDTGWDGALAGTRNRGLRWDSGSLLDAPDRFEVALRVLAEDGADATPGYPPTGDRIPVQPPVTASVTLRRTQAFNCRPGEALQWTYGEQTGDIVADEDGVVTVANLPIDRAWTTLTVERR